MSVGAIAIDGTKIKAETTMDQNRDYRQIASEILAEAEEIDRQDELYGQARGDELPEALRTPDGRRQALDEAERRIEGAVTGESDRSGEPAEVAPEAKRGQA